MINQVLNLKNQSNQKSHNSMNESFVKNGSFMRIDDSQNKYNNQVLNLKNQTNENIDPGQTGDYISKKNQAIYLRKNLNFNDHKIFVDLRYKMKMISSFRNHKFSTYINNLIIHLNQIQNESSSFEIEKKLFSKNENIPIQIGGGKKIKNKLKASKNLNCKRRSSKKFQNNDISKNEKQIKSQLKDMNEMESIAIDNKKN